MTKAKKASVGPKNDSERTLSGNISYLIYREWFSKDRAESIQRTMDLFEYFLTPEVAVYVDRQDDLKRFIYCKLQEIMRSENPLERVETMKRISERFFG